MGLVRRFVLGETRVAINAIHGLLWRRNVLRSKVHEAVVQRLNQLQHRSFDQRFKFFFARLEPLAAIIALESAEKRESVRRETGEKSFHDYVCLRISKPAESLLCKKNKMKLLFI